MVVEQIEVVEHRIIEEGKRPLGGALLPQGLPFTSIRESRETYEQRSDGITHDGRYEVTGERDVSREPSFLHTSANYGQHIEISPPLPRRYNVSGVTSNSVLNTSGDSRISYPGVANTSYDTTVINNYGYDIHEVNTTEGGARIIETHGSGPLRETSRIEHVEETITRPTIVRSDKSQAGHGSSTNVFSVPAPDSHISYRQEFASDNESLARKDSYRAMQSSWDGEENRKMANILSSTRFPQQSQTSLVSRRNTLENTKKGVGCLKKVRSFYQEVRYALKTAEYTPELIRSLCCILLLVILLLILVFMFFNAILNYNSVSEFLLYPPVCEECRRKNPALVSSALPSSVFVHFYSRHQAHFELRGNTPFKSNSFTAIDFSTGYVAYADHSLTDASGSHFTCFLMPLDKSAIDSIDQLSEAVLDSDYEIQSKFGWQEFYQFDPEPIEPIIANQKFTDPVDDCHGAKWYLLRQTVHSKDASCSDCYDFCLPDWAVVRKEKYEDKSTLGVRRLNCFRLYVPEWRNFRVETDIGGGHWKYPLSSESTKRDKTGEWVNWIPTTHSQGLSRNRKSILNTTA
uniref:BRICHOS domain-containing protein n=1 Tax=Caenorhabditis tropicalis TaxID=1561998 RepID=A0A1I7UJP2_9PELO